MSVSDNSTSLGNSMRHDPRSLHPDFDPAGFFASNHQVSSGELSSEQARLSQQGRQYTDARITNIYNSPARQKQYADYLQSLRGMYTGQVNDQQDVASRQLKFADARNGLTGGSAAADAGGMLRKDYQAGLVSADANAQTGVDALRAADQAQKNNLIAVNDSAQGTGQGSSNALALAQGAVANNANAAAPAALGSFFGDVGTVYQQRQAANAATRGYNRAGLYGLG